MTALGVWLGLCLGALSASLLCLVIGRVAGSEAVATRHSRCVCGRALRLVEVVPVFPWLYLRGRTRCCGAAIPWRWPVLEACCGLSWAGAWLLGTPWGGVVVGSSVGIVALGEWAGVRRAARSS